jgi:hypothetical protein
VAGSALLAAYNPSGAYVTGKYIASTPTTLSFTPTVSGAWSVRLDPYAGSIGSVTLRR